VPRHVVILPYYCEEEVRRFGLVASWMKRHCRKPLDCTFLLAASPRAPHSDELYRAFSELGDCVRFQCPSQVFGYPEGPSAMFWDSMDFIAREFSGDGFALWFESDMVVTRGNWLEQLAGEWDQEPEQPLLMGCYVPHVYKFRWLRKKKLMLHPHINGGACYALDFAQRMPDSAREGVFDMSIYSPARKLGPVIASTKIGFSTTANVRRDIHCSNRCVLHGFMQDKNLFVREATRPVSRSEQTTSVLMPVQGWLDNWRRQVRVLFFRKGPKAMLENLMLAQRQSPRGRLPADISQ